MSTPDLLLEEAKRLVTIVMAWRWMGLPNPPSRETGDLHSPVREDRKESLSVFSDGRAFKDHATGDKGDVISFIRYCLGCDFKEAKELLLAMVGSSPNNGGGGKIQLLRAKSIPAPAITEKPLPEPMSGLQLLTYEEGVSYLLANPEECDRVDHWRHWCSGTTSTLAENYQISKLMYRGQRQIAFAVQVPIVTGDLNLSATIDAGYHVRLGPLSRAKAPWRFGPVGVGSFPFVLGSGHIETATTIHICEGQWDAVALADYRVWLTGESTWPDYNVVFGTRGAGSTGLLLKHWMTMAPLTAQIIIYPDADDAGDRATEKLVTELEKLGFTDIRKFPGIKRGEDLSDYLREQVNPPAQPAGPH